MSGLAEEISAGLTRGCSVSDGLASWGPQHSSVCALSSSKPAGLVVVTGACKAPWIIGLGAGTVASTSHPLGQSKSLGQPRFQGRKTNSTSSMGEAARSRYKKGKTQREMKHGVIYNQLTTLIWTYRKLLVHFWLMCWDSLEVASQVVEVSLWHRSR